MLKLQIYCKEIDPNDLERIFRSSLESHYVSNFLEILHDVYTEKEPPQRIYNTLAALTRVERFKMVLMFISRKDKGGLLYFSNNTISCIRVD